jgi:hypothetical protein
MTLIKKIAERLAGWEPEEMQLTLGQFSVGTSRTSKTTSPSTPSELRFIPSNMRRMKPSSEFTPTLLAIPSVAGQSIYRVGHPCIHLGE